MQRGVVASDRGQRAIEPRRRVGRFASHRRTRGRCDTRRVRGAVMLHRRTTSRIRSVAPAKSLRRMRAMPRLRCASPREGCSAIAASKLASAFRASPFSMSARPRRFSRSAGEPPALFAPSSCCSARVVLAVAECSRRSGRSLDSSARRSGATVRRRERRCAQSLQAAPRTCSSIWMSPRFTACTKASTTCGSKRVPAKLLIFSTT